MSVHNKVLFFPLSMNSFLALRISDWDNCEKANRSIFSDKQKLNDIPTLPDKKDL